MTPAPPPELLEFLKPYDEGIRQLALGLRAVVLEELSPSHENIYDAYNAVSIGYGSSPRLKDGICHIAVYSKHVNLGFNKGAQLPDPAKVLKGTGKWIRHITLKSIEDTGNPIVRKYLQNAKEQAGAPHPDTPAPKVHSVVKAIYPRRRRPGQSTL
ncbi:MAG: DUF1801 domain-containing protein [Bryobacteraceae bacterium]